MIGTSIALGLTDAGWEVSGWDPDPVAQDTALAKGAILAAASTEGEAVVNADLVVLSGPPHAVIESIRNLETEALVIDVAGVKESVCNEAVRLTHFVGTHPMAGREQAGPATASSALFRGAAWVVATDGALPEDLVSVEEIIVSLGANPIRMTAAQHDDAVAAVSHLPQILAASLVRHVNDHPDALPLAAGSFRDLTRVALSPPDVWSQLLVENRAAVGRNLSQLTARMGGLGATIESGQIPRIESELNGARDIRRRMAPPVVAVRVLMEDRPGELAAVGRALAASAVDVRDLQLRHAPHGGGGVLTLSVRPGEYELLCQALIAEEFRLIE